MTRINNFSTRVAVCLSFLFASCVCAADIPPYFGQAQELLQIPNKESNEFLDVLKKTLSHFNPDATEQTKDFEASANRLVDLIVAGVPRHAMINVILPRVHINGSGAFPDITLETDEWKYPLRSIVHLGRELYVRGSQMRKTNPRRGAQFARAGMFIQLQDGFMGWFRPALVSKHSPIEYRREVFVDSLELADDASTKLQALLTEYHNGYLKYRHSEDYEAMLRAMQRMIDAMTADDQLAAGKVMIARSKSLWNTIPSDQLYAKWAHLNYMWQALNLARLEKNDDVRKLIELELQGWRQVSKSEVVQRWISESLDREGHAPSRVWSEPDSPPLKDTKIKE
ncbi:MAG: hypothetical protein GC159_14305 [Phycisphaera sp.]|nr:hypothetical protein [Phycisphaera sp.]